MGPMGSLDQWVQIAFYNSKYLIKKNLITCVRGIIVLILQMKTKTQRIKPDLDLNSKPVLGHYEDIAFMSSYCLVCACERQKDARS